MFSKIFRQYKSILDFQWFITIHQFENPAFVTKLRLWLFNTVQHYCSVVHAVRVFHYLDSRFNDVFVNGNVKNFSFHEYSLADPF